MKKLTAIIIAALMTTQAGLYPVTWHLAPITNYQTPNTYTLRPSAAAVDPMRLHHLSNPAIADLTDNQRYQISLALNIINMVIASTGPQDPRILSGREANDFVIADIYLKVVSRCFKLLNDSAIRKAAESELIRATRYGEDTLVQIRAYEELAKCYVILVHDNQPVNTSLFENEGLSKKNFSVRQGVVTPLCKIYIAQLQNGRAVDLESFINRLKSGYIYRYSGRTAKEKLDISICSVFLESLKQGKSSPCIKEFISYFAKRNKSITINKDSQIASLIKGILFLLKEKEEDISALLSTYKVISDIYENAQVNNSTTILDEDNPVNSPEISWDIEPENSTQIFLNADIQQVTALVPLLEHLYTNSSGELWQAIRVLIRAACIGFINQDKNIDNIIRELEKMVQQETFYITNRAAAAEILMTIAGAAISKNQGAINNLIAPSAIRLNAYALTDIALSKAA